MSLRVRLTREARQQADLADEWWQKNRTAAPDAFWNEFIEALERLTDAPEIGVRVSIRSAPNLRRVLLPTSKYHVYYEATARVLKVRAVWGAQRGRPPSLAGPTRRRSARR